MTIFYCAMCHNFGPSLTIIMSDGHEYFEKKNYVKKIAQCHMSNFNRWMTINDINMASWVQL